MHSGHTGSVWERPINDFVYHVPEFDSIAFPIVKRIFPKTIGGEPEGPEPTGFKLLIEVYEPKGGLVPVQPMAAPSGLLFYMDFKYQDNNGNEEDEKKQTDKE